MKFPNWFKISWWVLLILFSGAVLLSRLSDVVKGESVPFDIYIFLIFVALMLVPIFSEIEFFGMKFKKEIDDLKGGINLKFGELKNVIKNNQSQTLNATFQGYGPPPPDNKLPQLEQEIEEIINEKLKAHKKVPEPDGANQIGVPPNNIQMFKVRYNIETQIRRIWENRYDRTDDSRMKHLPIVKIIQELAEFGIIDKKFNNVLREILSICNYAIHGEKVSDNQVSFVSNSAVQVLDYLRQVK
ncbi:MAG: hypothetical protein QNK23_11965 [Crocinitomicaceae bacterium]|nr:hypothetical protein [Crocinitomicaceae bacterium]